MYDAKTQTKPKERPEGKINLLIKVEFLSMGPVFPLTLSCQLNVPEPAIQHSFSGSVLKIKAMWSKLLTYEQ